MLPIAVVEFSGTVRGMVDPRADYSLDGSGKVSSALYEIVRQIPSLTDGDLSAIVEVVKEEQQRRALDNSDTNALITQGMVDGFDSRGKAKVPYLHEGVLVVPGFLTGKIGKMNHDCIFVRFGNEYWSWEHPDLIEDKVTNVSNGQMTSQKSVSLIPGYDGLAWEVIDMSCRSGAHRMKSAKSFVIKGGKIEYTGEREAKGNTPSGFGR